MIDSAESAAWLTEEREGVLDTLWRRADAVRRASVGDDVHLRGLIEISNVCVRGCHYCGLRAGNLALSRYRMTTDEILDCVRAAVGFGYGTVVLQAGEDPAHTREWVADLVRRIKDASGLAVTLSLGERCPEDLAAWRAAGADRYLLRFETSNPELFAAIHPPRGTRPPVDRLAQLKTLRALGYEVGSGVMVGIPGQTIADLLADLALFRELDLDMIGVGPFIPHPDTPLGRQAGFHAGTADGGTPGGTDARDLSAPVPATELMTCKMLALSRLACPRANIPSTSALATLNLAQGRELGLQRGANVLMPNLTPPRYRAQYEIYPAKACVRETAAQCHGCMRGRIARLGRTVGRGPGSARPPVAA